MEKFDKPGAIIIEGHIQGLSNTRSLGEAGIPVYVVDKNDCIARYSKFCIKYFKCPDYTSDNLSSFLIKIAIRENLKDWVLIPSNDHAVISLSKNKTELEKYFRLITPAFDIIENIYNKSRLLNIANCNGIPIPITYSFQEEREYYHANLHYPVLTKSNYGLDFYKIFKKKVFLSESQMELKAHLSKISERYPIKNTFSQELIPSNGINRTISFAAFCSDGNILSFWMGAKLREHPIRFGTATFSVSIFDGEILELSKILIDKLRYTGVCEIEFLNDPRDGKNKLIEINARTWLWVGLAKACGVDFAKMIYHFVNKLPYNYPDSYKTNIKWRNSFTDLTFTILSIFKGIINLKTVCQQNKGMIIDAVSCKGDNKPFLAYFYLLITYLFRR